MMQDDEIILNGKPRKERTRCFLDSLPRRAPKTCNTFAHALRVARYEYLNSECDEKQPSLLSNPDCSVTDFQKVFTPTDFSEKSCKPVFSLYMQMLILLIY